MMSWRRMAIAGLIVPLCPVVAVAQTNDYFWPDQMAEVPFKEKDHAFRRAITMTAGKTVTIAGQQYREITVAPAGKAVRKTNKFYIRADADGLYSRRSLSADEPEVVDLKLPAKVGDSWQTVDDEGKPSQRQVDSIQPCDVRGAKFERCIRVSYRWIGFDAAAVFTPKYGEIVNSQKNGFIHRRIDLSAQ